MKKALYIVALYALPIVVVAQTFDSGSKLDAYVEGISKFIGDKLVPLVVVLALLAFIWGMFQYFILGGHDEEKQKKGKSLMIWGIVGFILIIGISGLVNFLASILGIEGGSIPIPKLPGT